MENTLKAQFLKEAKDDILYTSLFFSALIAVFACAVMLAAHLLRNYFISWRETLSFFSIIMAIIAVFLSSVKTINKLMPFRKKYKKWLLVKEKKSLKTISSHKNSISFRRRYEEFCRCLKLNETGANAKSTLATTTNFIPVEKLKEKLSQEEIPENLLSDCRDLLKAYDEQAAQYSNYYEFDEPFLLPALFIAEEQFLHRIEEEESALKLVRTELNNF